MARSNTNLKSLVASPLVTWDWYWTLPFVIRWEFYNSWFIFFGIPPYHSPASERSRDEEYRGQMESLCIKSLSSATFIISINLPTEISTYCKLQIGCLNCQFSVSVNQIQETHITIIIEEIKMGKFLIIVLATIFLASTFIKAYPQWNPQWNPNPHPHQNHVCRHGYCCCRKEESKKFGWGFSRTSGQGSTCGRDWYIC